MSKTPRGLGKGVSALLGNIQNADQIRKPVGYVNKDIAGSRAVANKSDVLLISVDQIEPNPYQPRMSFDQEALDELTSSIKTLGLIQPITVRKVSEGRYQIISGERRFRACRQAGLTMIPAYTRQADDQGMLEMAIVENVQRENLDPIETALSFQRLIDECSLTQEQMAERVGKKRVTVTNFLRLLKLPVKVQHDLKVGLLSVGHAKVLLGVEDPEMQQNLCDLCITEGLSVRELENTLRNISVSGRKNVINKNVSAPEVPESYYRLAEEMKKYFSGDVSFKRKKTGSGSISVNFSSDEEVEKFMNALSQINS